MVCQEIIARERGSAAAENLASARGIGDPTSGGKYVMSPEQISDLVRIMLRRWGPGGDAPPGVLKTVLGRMARRAPGIWHRLRDDAPDGSDQLEQLVIAFGVGWGRHVGPRRRLKRGGGWEDIWEPAVRWLEDRVFLCMLRTSRYLEFALNVEGYAFCEHPELNRWIAQRMVVWLIDGTCPCAKLALEHSSSGSAQANYVRRALRCFLQHRVAGWNPEACSFYCFVWQAVKGPNPRKGLRSGAFLPKSLAQSMHFWNLYHDCHLRLVDVLVWVCGIDGSLNFEGLPCLTCLNEGRGQVYDPDAFRAVIPRLVIPKSFGGRYVKAAYWNCQHCRKLKFPDHAFFPGTHYYPDAPDGPSVCPKCRNGRGPGAKRSHVYLLGAFEPRSTQTGCPERDLALDEVVDPASLVDGLSTGGACLGDLTGNACDPRHGEGYYAQLDTALSELDPLASQIIRLRFHSELTPVEVARRLNLPPDRAGALEALAMRTLRAKIEARLEEDEGE